MAITNDCLYEHTCLYSFSDCFSGRENDRIRIVMEAFGLTVIFICAILYALKHVKKTLTVGENAKGCQNCPLDSRDFTKRRNMSS